MIVLNADIERERDILLVTSVRIPSNLAPGELSMITVSALFTPGDFAGRHPALLPAVPSHQIRIENINY